MTFNIILSGVTGHIGSQVLHQALQNPCISSVIALSRRPLPDLQGHKKLEVVLFGDFTHYSDEVIAKLSAADGCIWCMTTTAGNPLLELEYPKAFASALAPTLARTGKRFRYLHITGAMVERDPNKSLWLKGSVRKTKGQGELQMIGFAGASTTNGLWETIIARPGMVVQRGSYAGEVSMMLAGLSGSFIRSDELALALIDAVVHGSEELLLPLALLQRGQKLMRDISENQKQAM